MTPAPNTPHVDPDDSAQNARVQDWLTAWANKYLAPDDDDWHTYECVIEMIQETYNPHTDAGS
jgi:hypothetical protein